jgi:hypothetical protein
VIEARSAGYAASMLAPLLALFAFATPAAAQRYFELRVVDETGAAAPCVRLETVHHIALVTDVNGRAAFYEPGLMATDVFFTVSGGGVEHVADGFGFRGRRVTVREGGSVTFTVTRTGPPGCIADDLETRRLARGVPAPSEWMTIAVADRATGRGVPLVEVGIEGRRFVSDSAGLVAIDPLGLEGTRAITLFSHGYTFDGPSEVDVESGGMLRVEATRVNVAARLYRVTGGGIYRDSVLLGRETPIARPTLDGLVVGQDSVFSAVFRGRLFFIWGDTNRPAYPLGNFHASGATAPLPAEGLDPSRGIDLEYFVDADGFSRGMAPPATVPGEGVTWLGTLVVVPDAAGEEQLHATFAKVGAGFERFRFGMLRYDVATDRFVEGAEYTRDDAYYPREGAFVLSHGERAYVYTHEPTRIPATSEALLDESTYESFTPIVDDEIVRDAGGRAGYGWRRGEPRVVEGTELEAAEVLFGHFVDADSGRAFVEHGNGSLERNEHTGRFVRLITPRFALGETWFSLADTPMGPWVNATRVIAHERYTFYNPRHHRPLDGEFGRIVRFEGTYTTSFSGNPDPTPRYDYNQVMYELDLDRPELAIPVPIYERARGELGDASVLREGDGPIDAMFLAPIGPRPNAVPVAWSGPSCEPRRLLVGGDPPTRPIFWALPPEVEPGPHQTALYEIARDDGTFAYGVDEVTNATPIAVVWKNPIAIALPVADYLPAFRADAGPDRCMDAPGPLALDPGEWRLDGAPFEPGDNAGAGLHVVERVATRDDGFVRTDSFLLRVGDGGADGGPLAGEGELGGCGCDAARGHTTLLPLLLLPLARRRARTLLRSAPASR